VLLILYIVLYPKNKEDKREIQRLEVLIQKAAEEKEDLILDNEKLSDRNSSYLDSILVVNKMLDVSDKRNVGAIRYYEKRLRDIDKLVVNEHYEFFADRYLSDSTEVGND